jgi:hypothetical protein
MVLVATFAAGCSYNPNRASNGDGGPPSEVNPSDDAPVVGEDAPEQLPAGLIAWYQMETLDGGNQALDATGNNHTGTCSNCPGVAAGRIGNAFVFGAGDRIDVPHTAAFVLDTAFTIAAWVRFDAFPAGTAFACPFSKPRGSGTQNTWQLCIRGQPNRWAYLTEQSNGSQFLETTQSVPQLGTFVHVAIVWTGTLKQLFVNGEMTGTTQSSTAIEFDDDSILFGADIDNGAQTAQFLGALDDLRIYNRALDATELGSLSTPSTR